MMMKEAGREEEKKNGAGCRYRPEGMLMGSVENREALSSAASLERAAETGKILEAPAVMCDPEMNLTVDLGCGIKGVIPRREAVYLPYGDHPRDIAVITRVGKPVCFKILSIEKNAEGKAVAVLSRRLAQLDCIRNYLCDLIPGDIIPAKITHLEHFGAFADVGCGVVALMPIDCISVSRISHPRDRFCVGMYIRAIVKNTDFEEDGTFNRMFITHKELLGTWQENADMFEAGQTVSGIIRSIEDYGVFVELSPNLAGLADRRDDITVGQTAAVFIKSIIPERMKIKLVLIDSCRGELIPKRMKYCIPNDCEHLDNWIYSPPQCGRTVGTDFSIIRHNDPLCPVRMEGPGSGRSPASPGSGPLL